ncbi:MAG: hypothetical protein JJ992_26575, partial [Planctomycetes bacterium]|nr:hypothetical protein [Planctomycetota bacterium]
ADLRYRYGFEFKKPVSRLDAGFIIPPLVLCSSRIAQVPVRTKTAVPIYFVTGAAARSVPESSQK